IDAPDREHPRGASAERLHHAVGFDHRRAHGANTRTGSIRVTLAIAANADTTHNRTVSPSSRASSHGGTATCVADTRLTTTAARPTKADRLKPFAAMTSAWQRMTL